MRTPFFTAAVVAGALVAQAGAQQPTFSSESQVVVLHVAVLDGKGYIGGLDQQAFQVFENQQRQPVTFFSNQDAPVTVGLLIDSSGSMGANRDRVIAAAVAFAQNSNPEDDVFVLAFNEQVKAALPDAAPFTRDIPTLREAMDRAIAARGQSAVYSALDAGLHYLERGHYERKVLVLVSDGGDNASTISRADVLARAQASNALIYTVGLIDPMETEADPGFLRQVAGASGGLSFEPHSVADVGKALQRVARDIRSLYTVGYVPSAAGGKEALRAVGVRVTLPNGRKASVRTRRAYLAGQGPETTADAGR
jgi:Ca-activated chloride channel family protein